MNDETNATAAVAASTDPISNSTQDATVTAEVATTTTAQVDEPTVSPAHSVLSDIETKFKELEQVPEGIAHWFVTTFVKLRSHL
ncbi:MAG: hypothetical protein WA777_18490 [Rhodanobacter sp.]